MVSQLGRAGLLQCLAAHDPAEWERLADSLGYAPRIDHDAAVDGVVRTEWRLKAIMPSIFYQDSSPKTRFLRPLSRRRLGPEGAEEPEWFRQAEAFVREDDPAISAPSAAEPPARLPLTPWPRLWPFLKLALGALLLSRRPDLPRVVDILARGQWIRRMPRSHRPVWASGCLLVIDYAEPLLPFWEDFHELKERLPSLRGQSGLDILAFPEGDPLGRCWREDKDGWRTGPLPAARARHAGVGAERPGLQRSRSPPPPALAALRRETETGRLSRRCLDALPTSPLGRRFG